MNAGECEACGLPSRDLKTVDSPHGECSACPSCRGDTDEEAVRVAEIDLANTVRAQVWRSRQALMVAPEDRALALDLRNTIRRNAWRMKAGLPLRPTSKQVAAWHALLNLRSLLGAWRRNHPRAAQAH